MRRGWATCFLVVWLVLGMARPVAASSLPQGQMEGQTVVGLGLGPAGGVDFQINKLSLGFSLGTSFFKFSQATADIRLLYEFFRDPFSLALVVGVVGDTSFGRFAPGIAPEVGVAITYFFIPGKLVLRVNAVASIPVGASGRFFGGFFAPAGGIELGYRFNSRLEGTLGFTGHGEFIGLRVLL